MSDELTEFLNARLDEDEISEVPGRYALDDLRLELKRDDPYMQHLSSRIEDGLDIQQMYWRQRAQREVAAKRAILKAYEGDGPNDYSQPPDYWNALAIAVGHLAAAYSDHPDYDPEWGRR